MLYKRLLEIGVGIAAWLYIMTYLYRLPNSVLAQNTVWLFRRYVLCPLGRHKYLYRQDTRNQAYLFCTTCYKRVLPKP